MLEAMSMGQVSWSLLGLPMVLLTPGVLHADEEVYRDQYVIAYVHRPSVLLGNLHGDEVAKLKVFGKTYRNVTGSTPYYLSVAEIHSILFVTKGAEEDARLHVINVDTKKAKEVRLGNSRFGSDIGYERFGRKQGEPFTDYVQKLAGEVLQVHSVSLTWQEIINVDLATSRVVRRETVYTDKHGRVTKRYVDGKRVEYSKPTPGWSRDTRPN